MNKLSPDSRLRVPWLRRALAIAGAALVAGIAVPAAQACSYPSGEQVFSPWDDQSPYVLNPDGGFESGAQGWSLSGRSKVVSGNESHYIHAAADRRSLSLPAGSVAISPPICVDIATPTLRLMARNTGASSSRLRIEAVYSLLGLVNTKVAGDVIGASAWAPTDSIPLLLGLSTVGGTIFPSSIQVRFIPLDSKGSWQIDDFYLDPYSRR